MNKEGILAEVSDDEMRRELKRRESAKLKEEYEKRNRVVATLLHHKKAFIEVAKEMGDRELVRILEEECLDCADYRVEIRISRDKFIDKCYEHGRAVWEKFQ
jgi:hypothetical protein